MRTITVAVAAQRGACSSQTPQAATATPVGVACAATRASRLRGWRSLAMALLAVAVAGTLGPGTAAADSSSSSSSSSGVALPLSAAVHLTWSPAIIVVSYLIAVLGSFTSLQLMKRRTGVRGLRNWMLLVGGSVALGAIGIWSMHFIGMQACSLTDDQGNELMMAFEPGLTVVSLLVAVVIVAAGFLLAGEPHKVKVWRTCIVGVIGGCGVSVMHYLGMLGMVSQARIEWDAGIIVASVIVGCVAAIAAFLILFHLQQIWQNDIRLQCIIAVIMGIAVCGMHYTGMAAASWTNDFSAPPDFSQYASPMTLMAVIIALSVTTCAALLSVLVYRYYRLKVIESRKSPYLTLAALVRNSRGHVLCTLANTIPSVVIDSGYDAQKLGAFNRLNPDFLRMLKISFNWANVPRYQRHLEKLHQEGSVNASSSVHTALPMRACWAIGIRELDLRVFEQFVTAVSTLCAQLHIPMEQAGFLYFAPTGSQLTLVVPSSVAARLTRDARSGSTDLHFLPAAQIHSSLAEFQLPKDVAPDEWLSELADYQRRVLMPVAGDELSLRDELLNELLREAANELLQDKEQTEDEVRAWRTTLGKYVNTRAHLAMLASNAPQWKDVRLDPMVKAQLEKQLADEREAAISAAAGSEAASTPVPNDTQQQQANQAEFAEGGGSNAADPTAAGTGGAQPHGGSILSAHPSFVHGSRAGSTNHRRPLAPAAVVAPCTLYLGLLYVQVSPLGLRVLLHRNGPLSMIPLVKFQHQHAVTQAQLRWVRDALAKSANAGRIRAGSKNHREREREAQATGNAAATRSTQPGGNSVPSPGAPGGGGGGGGDDDSHAVRRLQPRTMSAAAATAPSAAFEPPIKSGPSLPVTEQLLSFQSDFLRCIDQLGKYVGSKADLTAGQLWTDEVIVLSAEVSVVCFASCSMSATYPPHYSLQDTQLLPFSIFDIICQSRHPSRSAHGWIRKLLAATMEQGRKIAQNGGQTAGQLVNLKAPTAATRTATGALVVPMGMAMGLAADVMGLDDGVSSLEKSSQHKDQQRQLQLAAGTNGVDYSDGGHSVDVSCQPLDRDTDMYRQRKLADEHDQNEGAGAGGGAGGGGAGGGGGGAGALYRYEEHSSVHGSPRDSLQSQFLVQPRPRWQQRRSVEGTVMTLPGQLPHPHQPLQQPPGDSCSPPIFDGSDPHADREQSRTAASTVIAGGGGSSSNLVPSVASPSAATLRLGVVAGGGSVVSRPPVSSVRDRYAALRRSGSGAGGVVTVSGDGLTLAPSPSPSVLSPTHLAAVAAAESLLPASAALSCSSSDSPHAQPGVEVRIHVHSRDRPGGPLLPRHY